MGKTATRKTYITTKDVQKMLGGISNVMVVYLRQEGKLSYLKADGHYLHDLNSVEALVAQRRERLQQKLERLEGVVVA